MAQDKTYHVWLDYSLVKEDIRICSSTRHRDVNIP